MLKKVLILQMWPDSLNPEEHWKTNVKNNGYEVLVILQTSLGTNIPGEISALMDSKVTEEIFEAFKNKLEVEYLQCAILATPFDTNMVVEVTAEGNGMMYFGSGRKRAMPMAKAMPSKKRKMSHQGPQPPAFPPPAHVIHNVLPPPPPSPAL